ncbi:MAG: type III pantothenate kinase [bacterium]
MNLLAIDQGNSRTKFWAKTADGDMKWSCVSGEESSCAELKMLQQNMTIALSSVNLPNRDKLVSLLKYNKLFILSQTSQIPIKIAYNNIDRLGIDRIMAAIGAMRICRTPVITVLAGTATVVDLVSTDGTYRGGFIAPGISSAAEGLYAAAPALPQVALTANITVPGTTPEECVQAGIVASAIGGIKEMVYRLSEFDNIGNNVIVSGGWGRLVADYVGEGVNFAEDLVLQGVMYTLECICNDAKSV